MSRYGKLGTQYFDDAGDPLSGGKIQFDETGTSTPKTTYSDDALSVPNTNPVILSAAGRQPSIFFDGSAKATLFSSADVQIEQRDPDGIDPTGNFDDWNALTTYGVSDLVTGSDGLYYRSFAAGNVNNDPISTPTKWQEVEFINTWNTNVTYDLGVIVKGSNNNLFKSIVGSNLASG